MCNFVRYYNWLIVSPNNTINELVKFGFIGWFVFSHLDSNQTRIFLNIWLNNNLLAIHHLLHKHTIFRKSWDHKSHYVRVFSHKMSLITFDTPIQHEALHQNTILTISNNIVGLTTSQWFLPFPQLMHLMVFWLFYACFSCARNTIPYFYCTRTIPRISPQVFCKKCKALITFSGYLQTWM